MSRCLQLTSIAATPRACNAGIAHGTLRRRSCFSNNDVCRAAAFLERLLGPREADTHVGSAAAVLLRPGERVIDSAGLTVDPDARWLPAASGSARALCDDPATDAPRPHRRRRRLPAQRARTGRWPRRADLPLPGGPRPRAASVRCRLEQRRSSRRPRGPRRLRHRGSGLLHAAPPPRGAARGYLLRRYGILSGRRAPRAFATEALRDGARRRVLARPDGAAAARLGRLARGAADHPAMAPSDGLDTPSASSRACDRAASTARLPRPQRRPSPPRPPRRARRDYKAAAFR